MESFPSASEGGYDAPVALGDERSLVRSARRGDLAAFNALVLLHQKSIYNTCYRSLGNSEDAADATQDAFLHAYRSVESYRGEPEGFRAWLVRIAVNACYDQLRKKKRRPSESLDALTGDRPDEVSETPLQLRDPDDGPDLKVIGAETRSTIEMALLQLSDDQRMTVVLCDVQGLSYDEAAAAMSVELGTVKSRLSRGRAALRQLLQANGELPAAARRLES